MKEKSRIDFKKEWTQQDAPLIWVEMIYKGDVFGMKNIFGFSFGGHYFVSENQTTSFYSNRGTEIRAKELGAKKYKDIKFISKLLENTSTAEEHLQKVVDIINSQNLDFKSNSGLYRLLEKFFYAYSSFAAIYRFTRPSFYEALIKTIKKEIPNPKERNITFLLNNDFSKMNFVPNMKLKNLAEGLKKIGERRFEMHKSYLKTYIGAQKLFREIGKRLHLDSKEIQNCTMEEIKLYLINKKKINQRELKSRLKYFKFVYNDNNFKIETTSNNKNFREIIIKEIKGKVANAGYAKGIVKVIRETLKGVSLEEVNKIKKGEVLVVTSTSPEMVPAIKKASAIIADLGGTLSHAAIISRELGVPCIIGTKIATQVLKDGDIVEVDANNGVVKILK